MPIMQPPRNAYALNNGGVDLQRQDDLAGIDIVVF